VSQISLDDIIRSRDGGPHRCKPPAPWPKGDPPHPHVGDVHECECAAVYRLEDSTSFGLRWMPISNPNDARDALASWQRNRGRRGNGRDW
jgi:hypothetical protein